MVEIAEMLWQMADEEITRLKECILECTCYIRSENSSDDDVPQEDPENAKFTKAIKNMQYASEKTPTLLNYSVLKARTDRKKSCYRTRLIHIDVDDRTR